MTTEQELKALIDEAYNNGLLDGEIKAYTDMRKKLEEKHEIRDDAAHQPQAQARTNASNG